MEGKIFVFILLFMVAIIVGYNHMEKKQQPSVKKIESQKVALMDSFNPPNTDPTPSKNTSIEEIKSHLKRKEGEGGLTDHEIRILREFLKEQYGGEYYIHTPGRHAKTMEDKIDKYMENKDWANRNIRK